MDKNSPCYFLTLSSGGDVHTYSLREEGEDTPRILLFQERDDAERYVIMLEQDENYIVGSAMEMKTNEACLGDVIDILNEKGHDFLFVRNDDLFIPPPTD